MRKEIKIIRLLNEYKNICTTKIEEYENSIISKGTAKIWIAKAEQIDEAISELGKLLL